MCQSVVTTHPNTEPRHEPSVHHLNCIQSPVPSASHPEVRGQRSARLTRLACPPWRPVGTGGGGCSGPGPGGAAVTTGPRRGSDWAAGGPPRRRDGARWSRSTGLTQTHSRVSARPQQKQIQHRTKRCHISQSTDRTEAAL